MLARRFAVAIGLLMALIASQMPEYVQQYRQRLGGAVDELKAIVADFDAEATRLSLDREQAFRRLEGNPDGLARSRGTDMRATVDREARLERQQQAFATSGPISQYAVFLEDLDPRVAERAYAAYSPAIPVTSSGIAAGLVGLLGGWSLTHLAIWPLRRRRQRAAATSA
ncbi:MAG TPA: DUF2937 family protein [Lichenihabitans sp.]|jgi:hypothetical protein|nr:DUF2937 family protein [Lichenihabitans sp.]